MQGLSTQSITQIAYSFKGGSIQTGSRPVPICLSAAGRAGFGFGDVQYLDVFTVAFGAGSVFLLRGATRHRHFKLSSAFAAFIVPCRRADGAGEARFCIEWRCFH